MSELVVDRESLTRPTSITRYSSIIRPAGAALLVALGYYLGVKIGFGLTFQPHPVSTLWPPNSILLATLLLAPKRWWWFLLLAALPVHFGVELQAGVPVSMVACWFISNCCEALIGALLIKRFTDGAVRFDTARHVGVFIVAAVLAPFLSSFMDAGFVVLNGWGAGSYWQIFRMRFFSNVLAELTLVPFIVMWVSEGIPSFRLVSPYRHIELAVMVLALSIVGVIVLGGHVGESPTPVLLYAPLPFLLWAAVRFGPKGISTALVAVTFLAIWGAINGLGPFVGNSPEANALSVQLFLIVVSVPLIILAAVIQEQSHLRGVSAKNEEQLEVALDAAQMGTWDWHIQDNETRWSVHTKRIFGFQPTDPEVPPEVFYGMLHEDDRQVVRKAIEQAIRESGPYAAEFRMPQPNGTVRWVRGQGKVLFDEAGKPVRMVGVNVDITARKDAEEELSERNSQIRMLAGRLISAQESERRRISRELHDELSQRVAALSITISRLKRGLPATENQLIAELDEIYRDTNELNSHIRQLSHELHPAALEHLGLEKALAAYIAEFQRQEEIETTFGASLSGAAIPFETSVCLYRIAVEGLRNIAKHSRAKSASILLAENEDLLVLTVADSGRGFDIDAVRTGDGIGLISAEERVRLLDGKFEIKSKVNQGTKLIVEVPLR